MLTRRERSVAARRNKRTGSAGRWLAVALAVLLSLVGQSVVQTHVHIAGRDASAGVDRAVNLLQPAHRRTHSSDPLDCPACRQLARAGAVMLPTPVALVLPAVPLVWFALPLLEGVIARPRSHAWRSRGPPGLPFTA